MQKGRNVKQKERRASILVGEVMRGEHSVDILPNSAYDFAEERQAVYFSNMRKNMKSDMAYATMNQASQLDDIRLLKRLKINV